MLNDSTNKKESHVLWHGIILPQYHETLCPNIISATVFRLPLSERCNVSQCSCNRPKQHPAPSTFLPFPAAFAIATLLARRDAWSKSIPCTASAPALTKHPQWIGAGMKWCLPSWCKGSQPEIYSRIIVMYNKASAKWQTLTNYKLSNPIHIPIHWWQQVKETTVELSPSPLEAWIQHWHLEAQHHLGGRSGVQRQRQRQRDFLYFFRGLEGKLLDFDVGLGGQTVYRLIRWVPASWISETNTTASTWLLRPVLVTSSWQFLRHGQF